MLGFSLEAQENETCIEDALCRSLFISVISLTPIILQHFLQVDENFVGDEIIDS